jgi:hypothetical protein
MPPGEIALRETTVNPLVETETGVLVRLVPSFGPVGSGQAFGPRELQRLDDLVADAEQATGLRFAAYLGDLGDDTRAGAEGLLDAFDDDAPYTALVAISPGQRVVEIVTGTEAALRIGERGARAAVLSVQAACADGDLFGGLANGIRILTDHAGGAR